MNNEINKEERKKLAINAGNIHKQIKDEIQTWIRPGLNMITIANNIEKRIKELTLYDINNPIISGVGFPTGLSLNNCAAHWSPNPGDRTILNKNDVCKIDYGIHFKGIIIDSAFTISFDPKYDTLLEASKTSTEIAIKMAGPDSILGEIGEAVQENMESYEIDIDGKTYPIKTIKTLTGHQIDPYKIHSGKCVPNYKINYPERMLEDEYYAIETFATTGTGITKEIGECSHYMIDYNKDLTSVSLPIKEKKFLNTITDKFSTLAFCNRWLDTYNIPKYSRFVKSLCSEGVIKQYPPLCDIKGSFTSQFEETILITEKGNLVLSS